MGKIMSAGGKAVGLANPKDDFTYIDKIESMVQNSSTVEGVAATYFEYSSGADFSAQQQKVIGDHLESNLSKKFGEDSHELFSEKLDSLYAADNEAQTNQRLFEEIKTDRRQMEEKGHNYYEWITEIQAKQASGTATDSEIVYLEKYLKIINMYSSWIQNKDQGLKLQDGAKQE